MCRVPAGTGRRVDAVAADGSATLTAPTHFAPGDENCTITYEFARRGRLAGAQVSLKIQDRNNTVIYESNLLGLAADRRDSYAWNGQDTSNNLVTPHNSPYTVTLKVGNQITRTKQVAVIVPVVHLWTSQQNRIYMNTPDSNLNAVATVMIKRTNNSSVPAKMPVEVKWSFDEHANNTAAASTHQYLAAGNKRLGKKGIATAIHWEAHPNCSGTTASDDTYYQTSRVKTVTTAGHNLGKSFIRFKPSGLGGDKFRLRANIWHNPRTEDVVIKTSHTNYLPIWRRVSFTAYEMKKRGSVQDHISRYGTEAIMAPYYTNDTFVKYELGTVTAIDDAKCIKYIGLWDHDNNRQAVWNTVKRRVATRSAATNEVPSNEDKDKANSERADAASITARDQARARIVTCAGIWRDRIYNGCWANVNSWITDTGIPANAVVAIDSLHPKYCANAPDADSVTEEWRDFEWLTVDFRGNEIHPDTRWNNAQGTAYNDRALIYGGVSAARMKVVIAHEAGHETLRQFKRDKFRPRPNRSAARANNHDHTMGRGLMSPTGSSSTFNAREKEILRGFDNP